MQFMKLAYIICLAILVSIATGYAQVGIQTSFKPNEIVPAIYFGGTVSNYYSFQWNCFNVGVIPKDPYNQNKPSGSMYPFYSFCSIMGIGFLASSGREWPSLAALLPDSSLTKKTIVAIGYALIAPIILSNSQHHLILFGYDSSSSSPISSSLFIRFQTDYYDQRDVSWLRFAPSGGLELFFDIKNKPSNSNFNCYGMALQFAISRNWDVLNNRTIKSAYLGYIGTKFNFPF
jgi:hypothetical protein